MEVILQINHSEKNFVSKNISNVINVNGTLKEHCSIIDPIITFEGDISDFTNVNYMSIPVFNRSYFINNMISLQYGLFQINAHVDVLTSFANEIKLNSGIVRKQENLWNLYLDDGTFKAYQNPIVLTKEFPNGFTAKEFVLAVAG